MPKASRTANRRETNEVSLGNLTVNFNNFGVYVDGEVVELSVKQFEVLRVMLDHPDQILPYSTFADVLWDAFDKRRLRNLNVLVYRLRQKLAASYPFAIKTIRSRGTASSRRSHLRREGTRSWRPADGGLTALARATEYPVERK